MDFKLPKIQELQQVQTKKYNDKKKLFKTVLGIIAKNIKHTNQTTVNTFMFYEVPDRINGHLDYNYSECIKYLIAELTNEGYLVEFIQPRGLYIDWGTPVNDQVFPDWVKDKKELQKKTLKLLEKFPNAQKIEFCRK